MKIKNVSYACIVFLLCGIFSGCVGNRHHNIKAEKDKRVKIAIRVKGTIGVNKHIRLVMFSELPEPLYANQDNYKEYNFDLNNLDTLIKYETQTDIVYVKFFDCSKEINGKPFMIEPGDSCQLNISEGDYSLSFGNSKFLELQKKIFNIPIDIYQSHDYTKPEYNGFFIRYRDSLMHVVNAITQDYKSTIPTKQLDLIKLNMASQIELIYTNTATSIPSILPKENWEPYITCLSNLITEYKNQSDFNVKNSYNYAYYGNRLLRAYYLFTNHNDIESAADSAYQAIVKKHSGLLRDKMLCIFFNFRSNTRSWNNLMRNAASIIQDTIYKSSILALLNSHKTGSRAYDFKLLSDVGRFYTLNDFDGKVIVCHFWFNGCPGCSMLSKALLPLEEKYESRNDIIFININVDADTVRWKNGLTSQLYTGSSEINLNIGKKGWSSEMLKYYGYYGYPQVLLIDKLGNIISASPYIVSYTMEGLKNIDSLISEYAKKRG